MNKCFIAYTEAEKYINEGDILLFRRNTFFSYFIRIAGEGPYSHAALASWVFNELGERVRLEAVEFKEWIGGRSISLANYVEQHPSSIDVFTPNLSTISNKFICETRTRQEIKKMFNGRAITNELRRLTGLPYGWRRIWEIIKRTILPFFYSVEEYTDVENEKLIYPVCSTAIAWCYSKHFADLTHFKPDNYIEPQDLARSPLLDYMFTLVPDEGAVDKAA